jgi:hypothetical protein
MTGTKSLFGGLINIYLLCSTKYFLTTVKTLLKTIKLKIMTQQNELHTRPIHSGSMAKRMLQGGGIALILIIFFLSGPIADPNPQWPELWFIRPLIIVPTAGAMGGIFYYYMDHLRCLGGWKQVLAIIFSVIGYIVALWLGTVWGLNGTMWH